MGVFFQPHFELILSKSLTKVKNKSSAFFKSDTEQLEL